jgi:hypothetical protein
MTLGAFFTFFSQQAEERHGGVFVTFGEDELAHDVAPGVGEGVHLALADFGRERRHGAEDVAERGAIVIGDPIGEGEQFFFERRFLAEQLQRETGLHGGGIVMRPQHDAGELARAEGHQDAASALHPVAEGFRQVVGKHLVKRDGETDIGIARHGQTSRVA